MAINVKTNLKKLRRHLGNVFVGPQTLAFLPAFILAGYWFGGEILLVFLALLSPAAFAVAGMFSGTGPAWEDARDNTTGMVLRNGAEKALDKALLAEKATGKSTAVLALQLDDFNKLEQQFGGETSCQLLKQVAERIVGVLRESDVVAHLEGHRFAVVLAPIRRADIEMMIQLSARLQGAIAEPYSVDATRVFLTASVGFCLPGQTTRKTGETMLECAEIALEMARVHGAGSIRTFTRELQRRSVSQRELHQEAHTALELGQFHAWFQPQISTDTGQISGFEALARWEHPERGTILPADFLPAIAERNLQETLGDQILTQSLAALKGWDKSGFSIPSVSVNFSSRELENPKICNKTKWELDRFELAPGRLCVEILEDVIAASDNDIVVRNINALSAMGCSIDLDDFGTGHASIANIRRFSVHRIKIDRSFITRVDRDRDQQNMVAAVLTMAERLDIETLAEGVETIGEHAMLAQLGCGHVQGFSVARPMPFDATIDWIRKNAEKTIQTPAVRPKAV